MRSIFPICSAKFSTEQKTSAARKLESAQDRLRDINPEIEIELHQCRFSSENASQIVSEYDIVVDGSDNFATRYLSNDVCVFEAEAKCVRLGIPVRGANDSVRASLGRTLLPLPFSRAASTGVSPELRASGRARRFAGNHRHAASD